MNITSLATTDWNGTVPSIGNNKNELENLVSVLEIIQGRNDSKAKKVLKKCADFTNNIKDAREYYLASWIFDKSFKTPLRTIEFQDGKAQIPQYQIKALEKDFPGKDITKLLKSIDFETFDSILIALYAGSPEIPDSKKTELVKTLNDHSLYNAQRIHESLGVMPDIDANDYKKLELRDVQYFLSGKAKVNQGELRNILQKATYFVKNLNPASREDLKSAVALSHAINNIDLKDKDGMVHEPHTKLKTKLKNYAHKQIKSARNLSLFEKFVSAVATFFGKSVDHWLAVDPEFLHNHLKDIKGLVIEIPKNPSTEFKSWLIENKDNIDQIVYSNEQIDEMSTFVPPELAVKAKVKET